VGLESWWRLWADNVALTFSYGWGRTVQAYRRYGLWATAVIATLAAFIGSWLSARQHLNLPAVAPKAGIRIPLESALLAIVSFGVLLLVWNLALAPFQLKRARFVVQRNELSSDSGCTAGHIQRGLRNHFYLTLHAEGISSDARARCRLSYDVMWEVFPGAGTFQGWKGSTDSTEHPFNEDGWIILRYPRAFDPPANWLMDDGHYSAVWQNEKGEFIGRYDFSIHAPETRRGQ
jgi:hypothetical protein